MVTGALGPEICAAFHALKADEWARFTRAVTDWERTVYADQIC